jgi:hypothetical protein
VFVQINRLATHAYKTVDMLHDKYIISLVPGTFCICINSGVDGLSSRLTPALLPRFSATSFRAVTGTLARTQPETHVLAAPRPLSSVGSARHRHALSPQRHDFTTPFVYLRFLLRAKH